MEKQNDGGGQTAQMHVPWADYKVGMSTSVTPLGGGVTTIR